MGTFRYGKKSENETFESVGEDFNKCTNPVVLEPKTVRFHAPFNYAQHSVISVSNKTKEKLILQIHLTHYRTLRARPADFFLEPMGDKNNDACKLRLQTLPFEFDEKESYKNHMFVLFYAVARKYNHESDNAYVRAKEPEVFARCIPDNEWKKVKIPIEYLSETDDKIEDNFDKTVELSEFDRTTEVSELDKTYELPEFDRTTEVSEFDTTNELPEFDRTV